MLSSSNLSQLKDQINSELKEAMIQKNVFLRDTLRLIMAEVKRFKLIIDKNLQMKILLRFLKKMAKQRKDSIQQYSEGGRPDLEEIEKNELEVLEKYLPQALAGDALKEAIQTIISENNFSGMQDMGNVMKELRSRHPNAEMSEASSFVKELLS